MTSSQTAPLIVRVVFSDLTAECVDLLETALLEVSTSAVAASSVTTKDNLSYVSFTVEGALDAVRSVVAETIDPTHTAATVFPQDWSADGDRLLVMMDVDSTLITSEVIELLAAHAGVEDVVREVTESAMRGEIDFAESLHQRVATLKGLPDSVIQDVLATVEFTPGAEKLCRRLTDAGHVVGLVSGGFIQLVDELGRRVGASYVRANKLAIADNVLLGTVEGPVVDAEIKAVTMMNCAEAEGIAPQHLIAIGDGANDLVMLGQAHCGFAFNAKPVVAAAADVRYDLPSLEPIADLLGVSH